jgi:large subunit ribosomal protein L30e
LAVDVPHAIRLAVDTGKVLLGLDKTSKAALSGSGKLVIIAKGIPRTTSQDVRHYCNLSQLPVIEFEGGSMELGTICGKPFPVSALTIIDPGASDILKATEPA